MKSTKTNQGRKIWLS